MRHSVQAPDVKLFLFPLTGEVRIANDGSTDLTFVFYSLSSPSGALNGTNGVWTSIADTYDASGNGFIDATHEWTELTPNAYGACHQPFRERFHRSRWRIARSSSAQSGKNMGPKR